MVSERYLSFFVLSFQRRSLQSSYKWDSNISFSPKMYSSYLSYRTYCRWWAILKLFIFIHLSKNIECLQYISSSLPLSKLKINKSNRFIDYNPFDQYRESDRFMFEDLKIGKVVIGTQGIEDYWEDKKIKPIEITKLYEYSKGNLTSKH